MFMLLVMLLSTFLNQASSTSYDPFNFAFPFFDPNSCKEGGELVCFGSAVVSSGYIDVTPASLSKGNSVGRVLYKHPVLAWPATISTSFTVRISKDPNSTGSGEGMAFIMAQDDGPSPDNSYGSFMGLFNRTTEGGLVHQLAVELDTYYNNEFDPDGNHIGIDTKYIRSVATVKLNDIGVDLKGGRDVKVKIDYDGWGKKLLVFASYVEDHITLVLNHSLMMSKTVPSSVYVGFTGSTGTVSERHQILNWIFSSNPLPNYTLNDHGRSEKTKKIMIVVFPIVAGTSVLVICIYLLVKSHRQKGGKNLKKDDIERRSRTAANAPKLFTLKELSKATNNFSKENLLGTGGFGSVYRGNVSDPPLTIAVKKISATSQQGEREYLAEICTIGRLRHRNIVQLQGWCHERNHLLLVYEFMPNGSLDRFISKGSLDWKTRYNILTGLASALLYLHEESGSAVVHRDVKPNNVMLDSDYNAHLGDFGLARLLQNEASVTTMLAGTPGYLAPECSYTGKATPESDVFSFGIVVLEVVCGRRAMFGFYNNLVDYVWGYQGKGELLQCVDGKLKFNFNEEEVKRAMSIGLACSHPDPKFRPTMRKVVQMFLNPNEPLLDLPDSRPSAIYLPVHSSSSLTNGSSSSGASGSRSSGSTNASGPHSSNTLPDEMHVQYEG